MFILFWMVTKTVLPSGDVEKNNLFFEKFLAQVFALLSVLFSSVHFLHRVIILFNLSLKMLRGGRQTAELSLLK